MSSKIGRNDPCPCGSGKKYKNCHLGRALPVDGVEVDHADAAHAGRGEVHEHGATEAARSDHEDVGLLELALALEVELGDNEVAAVAFQNSVELLEKVSPAVLVRVIDRPLSKML